MHNEIVIPIYLKGKTVKLPDNSAATIEHVHIRGYDIAIKLKEHNELISANLLTLESTTFRLNKI